MSINHLIPFSSLAFWPAWISQKPFAQVTTIILRNSNVWPLANYVMGALWTEKIIVDMEITDE